MSNIDQQENSGAGMTINEVSVQKTPISDRAIAVAYLTTVSAAMIGWLYVLAQSARAFCRWVFG